MCEGVVGGPRIHLLLPARGRAGWCRAWRLVSGLISEDFLLPFVATAVATGDHEAANRKQADAKIAGGLEATSLVFFFIK